MYTKRANDMLVELKNNNQYREFKDIGSVAK